MEKGLLVFISLSPGGSLQNRHRPQGCPCRLQRWPPGAPAVRALWCLPLQHNRPPACCLLLLSLSLPRALPLSLCAPGKETLATAAAQDPRFRPLLCSPRPLVCFSGSASTSSSSTRQESSGDGLGCPCRAFPSSAPAGFTDESPPFPASPSSPVGSHASRVSMRCSAPPFPSP